MNGEVHVWEGLMNGRGSWKEGGFMNRWGSCMEGVHVWKGFMNRGSS